MEGSRSLADFYVSLYISIHAYIFLFVFAYFLHAFVYISWFFSYKIDRLMGGGGTSAPPAYQLSILYEKIMKYTQKHAKNMQIHIRIYKYI